MHWAPFKSETLGTKQPLKLGHFDRSQGCLPSTCENHDIIPLRGRLISDDLHYSPSTSPSPPSSSSQSPAHLSPAHLSPAHKSRSSSSTHSANYWTRQLMKAEETDPFRWGHSGYKEQHPQEFKSSSSETEKVEVHKKKKNKKMKKKKSGHKFKRKKKTDTLSSEGEGEGWGGDGKDSLGEQRKSKQKNKRKRKRTMTSPASDDSETSHHDSEKYESRKKKRLKK